MATVSTAGDVTALREGDAVIRATIDGKFAELTVQVASTTAYDLIFVRKEEEPILAPPVSDVGAIGWLRANLFSSVTNTILTLLGIACGFVCGSSY